MQEIFRTGGPFLGDAASVIDLSDLFDYGAFSRGLHEEGKDQ